jgi:hypothetical protein
MTFKEKILYHQIHPLKLSVDVATSFFTTYLLWQHNIVWFFIFFLLPSVITSLFLVKFANLEPIKNSSFGKYISKYMTHAIEAIRIAGQIIMWIAGWFHLTFMILIGFLIIIAAWCNGLFFIDSH